MNIQNKASNKEKIIWNMIGSCGSAFLSMILLLAVNRISGTESGGIFSLAYAVAQMMLSIGTFEVRSYQASDLKKNFSFDEYFTFRILTCLCMGIVSALYAFLYGNGMIEFLTIMLLCLYKLVEALADVFQGFFQQNDRIDLTGKAIAIRSFAGGFIFIIVLLLSGNMIVALISMFVSAMLFLAIVEIKWIKGWNKFKISLPKAKFKVLAKEAFPLFLGSFFTLYIVNEPKYAMKNQLSLNLQNIFGILFMPAFVINLFSQFIFMPMLTTMSMLWIRNDKKMFMHTIKKIVIGIFGISFISLLGTYFFGPPLLSLLYGVNIRSYKVELMIIMVGGMLNALFAVLKYLLIIMREQRLTLVGYTITLLFSLIVLPLLVKNAGLQGACWGYVLSMLMLCLVLGWMFGMKIARKNI